MRDEDRGLLSLLVGDGRSLLILTGLALLFSGGFALFLAARQEFLPHDIRYLGMSAEALCALGGCRVAAFMFHDRVAFGGTLLAVGTLYLWLAALPLRRRGSSPVNTVHSHRPRCCSQRDSPFRGDPRLVWGKYA